EISNGEGFFLREKVTNMAVIILAKQRTRLCFAKKNMVRKIYRVRIKIYSERETVRQANSTMGADQGLQLSVKEEYVCQSDAVN
ncbi:hypothetical protein MRX96_007727, partial [Rhipicephalus microplus]